MKTLTSLFQELRRGLQVDFSAGDCAVSQISREQWEFGRKIAALPIPCQQAVDGEGVAQIVDARSGLALWSTQAKAAKEFQKKRHETRMSVPGSNDVQEYRRSRVR